MALKNSIDFHFQRTSKKQKLRKGKSLVTQFQLVFNWLYSSSLNSMFFAIDQVFYVKKENFSLNGLCGYYSKFSERRL